MLGASNITSYDPVIPGLGNVYNFVLIIAIIIIMVGGALSLILRRMGKQGTDSMIMDVIIGLIVVIAFPSIYDGVARMINYLTQTLIAYPNPYYDYGAVLQNLWNNMEFAHGWSLWTLLTNSFFQIVFFIISGVIYIMLFFLGVARIFIIAAMIVAFPLSMGLRLIPFTRKLDSMIDDTLFGLMLASVMSAVVLGVGSYILSPSVWNSSSGNIFFQAVGQNGGQNWVAAAALLTAILMPTVLAPLTATVFQAASQVAMTGVGVGAMIASGVATGGAGGLSAAGSAVGTLGKTAQIAGQPPPSIAQKLVTGMKAFWLHRSSRDWIQRRNPWGCRICECRGRGSCWLSDEEGGTVTNASSNDSESSSTAGFPGRSGSRCCCHGLNSEDKFDKFGNYPDLKCPRR